MAKNYRYSRLGRLLRILYRKFIPVPVSPWTEGYVEDICKINLVPPELLVFFFVNCIDFLQTIKGGDVGDYLEFGVFNGNSIASMYNARHITKMGSRIQLVGFDSFEGLPDGSENEDTGVWKKYFYKCSFEEMEHCLRKKSVPPESITWVKGWYNETLTDELVKRLKLGNFSIILIDCDTYSSSKTVLNFLAPLITSPFIICFDDWKLNDLDIKGQGEYRAFNEFYDDNRLWIRAQEITSYNRKSKAFLISPKK